jgi:hypothetical protein
MIINEDLGIPDHIETIYEEMPRMVAPATTVKQDYQEEVLGRPVITEIVREENEPTEERAVHGRVFHDGDLAILVRPMSLGEGSYAPAGQTVLVLTRDPNEMSSVWGQDEFVRCMLLDGAEIGVLGTCLLPIVYDGESPQAHELMALFGGGITAPIGREIGT